MEALPIVAFVCVAANLRPARLKGLALVCRRFHDYVAEIKDKNIYWCLQYNRLGFDIPCIVEPIVDAAGFYRFLENSNQEKGLIYPKHPNHLRLVLIYFTRYINLETAQKQRDIVVMNGDLAMLKALDIQLTTRKFLRLLNKLPIRSACVPGYISIIQYYNLVFTVDQIVALGMISGASEALISFLIADNRITDLVRHDELLARCINDEHIVSALLCQGLDPRYQNNILVTRISTPEVYRVFRDDGRLTLDAHDQILIERLRDHTDVVCELLERGFVLTDALLRYYISNKCDDLHRILPHATKPIYPSTGSRLIHLSRDILDHGPIRYKNRQFLMFEEFARDVEQDDAMMKLLPKDDVVEFRRIIDNIHPLRKIIHQRPRIFIYGILTLASQFMALICDQLVDYFFGYLDRVDHRLITFLCFTTCMLITILTIMPARLPCEMKEMIWLGLRKHYYEMLLSIIGNFLLGIVLMFG